MTRGVLAFDGATHRVPGRRDADRRQTEGETDMGIDADMAVDIDTVKDTHIGNIYIYT